MTRQHSLLLGKYHIIRTIGQGGFGRTFLAEDISHPNKLRCVIKQFFPSGNNSSDQAAALFRLEAQRLKQLGNHPQIPKLLEYFEDTGNQYIAQEFIIGENLEQELAHNGAFNEAEIRSLLTDLLPVLQFIRQHKVIHRDIKPANIIRRRDRSLVLVDFGAAKYATETLLAKTGTLIGSPEYVAPEQAMGKAVFQSDLYSLGVTCIHLLTQMPPFELIDYSEGRWIWRDFLLQPVSEQLGQVLDKLLERGTKRRYQSPAAVLVDLAGTSSTNAAEIKHNFWHLPLVRTIVAGVGFVSIVTVVELGIVPLLEPINTTPPTVQAPLPKPQTLPVPIKPDPQNSEPQTSKSSTDQFPQSVFLILKSIVIIVGFFPVVAGTTITISEIMRGGDTYKGLTLIGAGIILCIMTSITWWSVEPYIEQLTTTASIERTHQPSSSSPNSQSKLLKQRLLVSKFKEQRIESKVSNIPLEFMITGFVVGGISAFLIYQKLVKF